MAAVLAVATMGTAMTVDTGRAEAFWRGGLRGGYGPGIGLGIVGGLAAGALIASAARPAYYGEPVYEGGPVCHFERRRVVLDDGSYRMGRVRVCD